MIETQVRRYVSRLAILCLLVGISDLTAIGQAASVELRTTSGRTDFRIGEVIPVELIFTAEVQNTYRLDPVKELPEKYPLQDTFRVEPEEGWEDPLGDYRNAVFKAETSGHVGIDGSVLSSSIPLSPKPFRLSVVLNDYVRFSRPGVYRVYVQDSRVRPIVNANNGLEHVSLTSNRLELKILAADALWQKDRLREAISSLAELRQAVDSHARSYRSNLADSCVTLRTLGTKEAGAAMVQALRDERLFSTCSFQGGLWGVPDRRFILAQMRLLLKDPEVPISLTYYDTLATVSVLAGGTADQLFAPSPRNLDRKLEGQILASLSSKTRPAKTITIETLVGISFGNYGGSAGGFVKTPKKLSRVDSRVLRIATDDFGQLSAFAQNTLQNYRRANALN